MFVFVKCPCGRTLRAQRSSERTTVRCWDCKTEVKVPRFRSPDGPQPIARLRGALKEAWAETAAGVILLALAVVAMMAIPVVGGWLGLALLVWAAIVYLRRIEEVGRLEQETYSAEARPSSWRGGLAKLTLAVLLVGAFVTPIWLFDGSRQMEYSPPIFPTPWPLVILLSFALLLPLTAFALVVRDAEGRLGIEQALSTAWKRRGAMIGALLLPFVVFVVVESALVGALYASEGLTTVLLDLFPLSEGHEIKRGRVVQDQQVADYKPTDTIRVYHAGLLRGASVLSSVPLSFLRGPEPRIVIIAYGPLRSEGYLLARLGITALALIALFGSLAAQAHWFGTIGLSSSRFDSDDEDEEDEGSTVSTRSARPSSSPLNGSRTAIASEPIVTTHAIVESRSSPSAGSLPSPTPTTD
ncbi:hypothetical protein [Tautonia marina]|uniref:hypothetical protein n=1 Tax=Tautonia marina TaxID=2653855 RepID=UPI0012610712|nr:hypothetical protein [Tautonia marina]